MSCDLAMITSFHIPTHRLHESILPGDKWLVTELPENELLESDSLSIV